MADACAASGVAACAEFELEVEVEHAAREDAARMSVSATTPFFVATMRRPHPSAGPFSRLFMDSSLRLVVKPGLLQLARPCWRYRRYTGSALSCQAGSSSRWMLFTWSQCRSTVSSSFGHGPDNPTATCEP